MKYIIIKCDKHCTDNHGCQVGRVFWGGLCPSNSPAIHFSLKAAKEEAGRLALQYPEYSFIVFQAVTVASVQSPVTYQDFK